MRAPVTCARPTTPIALLAALAGLAALLAVAATAQAATEVSGDILVDTTWTLEGSPYVIVHFGMNVVGSDGPDGTTTLTIEPGVVVEMRGSLGTQHGGAIHAVGTPERPILFTSAGPDVPGSWGQVLIGPRDRYQHVAFEHGGSPHTLVLQAGRVQDCVVRHSLGVAAWAEHGSTIERCLFEDNAQGAVMLRDFSALRDSTLRRNGGPAAVNMLDHDVAERQVVQGNHFEDNPTIPLRATSSTLLGGNTFRGNSPSAVELFTANVERDITWERLLDQATGEPVPYRLSYYLGLHVGRGTGSDVATLTIEPGTVLHPVAGLGSHHPSGAIVAVGTPEEPILISSPHPTPGGWGRLGLGPQDVVRHVVLEYGGRPGGAEPTLHLEHATIQDCVIRHSLGRAVTAVGTSLLERCAIEDHAADAVRLFDASTIRDTTFRRNAGVVVDMPWNGAPAQTVENSRFETNPGMPIRATPNAIVRGNTFSANGIPRVEVLGGEVHREIALQLLVDEANGAVMPYVFGGGIHVHTYASWSLPAGAITEWAAGAGLAAHGPVTLDGAPSQPILFRPRDPQDHWSGLWIADPTSVLDHIIVERAWEHGIAIGSGAAVTNCTVRDTRWDGIVASGGSRVQGCTIEGSGARGLLVQAGAIFLDNVVRDNALGAAVFWGHGGVFRNNLFDNAVNVVDHSGLALWSLPKEPGAPTNIIGGASLGGNFYSDYPGGDCDDDGIGDTHLPYVAPPVGVDWLPLTNVKATDPNPPVTTLSLAGTPGQNGWWTSTVTATLAAVDDVCGVQTTYVAIDGGEAEAYTGPVSIGEGRHRITYWSVDNYGNAEEAQETTVNVDMTPPSTTLGIQGPRYDGPAGIFVNEGTRLDLHATDALSGVASLTYDIRCGSGQWQTYAGPFGLGRTDGAYTVCARAIDQAGNVGTDPWAILLDATIPAMAPRRPLVGSVSVLDQYIPIDSDWDYSPDEVERRCQPVLGCSDPYDRRYRGTFGDAVQYVTPTRVDEAHQRLGYAYIVDGATVRIQHHALDPEVNGVASGLARVVLLLDGVVVANATQAPFDLVWHADIALGPGALRILAYDHLGHVRDHVVPVFGIAAPSSLEEVARAVQALAPAGAFGSPDDGHVEGILRSLGFRRAGLP